MIDILRYAKQQIPHMLRMVNLSAYAAFSPASRWQTYAAPYYAEADVCGLDFYPYWWDANRDYTINSTLINNTRQYSGKPVLFYVEFGWVEGGSDPGTDPTINIPASWLQGCINVCQQAGASYINGFLHRDGYGSKRWTTYGDPQWLIDEQVMKAITAGTLDVNNDGVINAKDATLAAALGHADWLAAIQQKSVNKSTWPPTL
jgi:hypothetical protein